MAMHDILRIIGLAKDPAPTHVKQFEASKTRLNAELDRISKDTFGSMVDDMVRVAKEKRRGNRGATRK